LWVQTVQSSDLYPIHKTPQNGLPENETKCFKLLARPSSSSSSSSPSFALGEGSDPGPDSRSRYPDPEFEMSYGVYIICTLQVYYRTYSYMYLTFNTLYFAFKNQFLTPRRLKFWELKSLEYFWNISSSPNDMVQFLFWKIIKKLEVPMKKSRGSIWFEMLKEGYKFWKVLFLTLQVENKVTSRVKILCLHPQHSWKTRPRI